MGSAPPDTTPPVITLSGASTLNITQGNGYTDAGATCIDNIDPTCTVTVSGSVNTSQTGTYIITYRAVDQAGNQATPITRTIQVQAGVIPPPPIVPDTTPPVITLSGASTLNITQGNGYTDAGATCIDNIDPTCTVTVSGSVNTSQTGTYIITYRAVDQAGNQATPITRTIQVQAGVIPPPPIVTDTTPPVITLSGANTLSITQGNTYTDAGATCTDNIDLTCTVTVSGSVNTTQTGIYIITYRAVDQAGNQATPITRTIQVQAGVIPPPPIVTPIITPPTTPIFQSGPGGGGG